MSVTKSFWWLLCWTLSCLSLQGVRCVAIWKLSVPRWVQNGTEDPVLLDCDGILTGRLDDSYTVGGPRDSQYRALRIIRPTTEMSGLYTCVVSSLAGTDSRKAVYDGLCASEKLHSHICDHTSAGSTSCSRVIAWHRRTCTSSHRTCAAPRYQRGRPRTRKTNGTYDIELSRSFSAEQLPQSVTFECVLEIPGTDYEVRRRTVYSPGYLYLTGGSSEITTRKSLLVVVFGPHAFKKHLHIYEMKTSPRFIEETVPEA
ncbi:hypothetical protein MRX96_019418 [Rhipicephalus microplus]